MFGIPVVNQIIFEIQHPSLHCQSLNSGFACCARLRDVKQKVNLLVILGLQTSSTCNIGETTTVLYCFQFNMRAKQELNHPKC